jgi:hypothetical protein
VTPQERIEAAKKKIADQREAHENARLEQHAIDLEKLAELEAEHGPDRLVRVGLKSWGSGAATIVVARLPAARDVVFRRYEQTIAKAKPGTTQVLDASHQLTESCLVYPAKSTDPALYAATMELAPGAHTHLALLIAKGVQGAEDEGKGD